MEWQLLGCNRSILMSRSERGLVLADGGAGCKTGTISGTSRVAQKETFLFVLPWFMSEIGGVTEVVRQLYKHMAATEDIQPVVLVTRCGDSPVRSQVHTTWHLPVTDPWPATRRLRALSGFVIRTPLVLWKLIRMTRSGSVRAINAHFPGLEYLCFTILKGLKLFSGPFLISLHGADISRASQSRGLERFLWRVLLRSATVITTCSGALAEQVIQFDATLRPKITAVHNGVDVCEFVRRSSARCKDDVTILSIGKFEHKKGHDILLQAFARLAALRQDVQLLLIGAHGPVLEQLRESITKADLEGRARIYTDIPHQTIPSLFEVADMFVLASRIEPLGIAILEAAASKVPVIATAVGGIPEIVTSGVTGLLVEPDDPDALYRAIEQVMHNPAWATSMADQLYKDVADRFNWTEKTHLFLQLAGWQYRSGVRWQPMDEAERV